ncbi:MAG TPA: hypothetical protein VF808_04260 [Ktedonobacterales bacterium]
MDDWLLPFLRQLRKVVCDYLATAEQARHDEMELKILREALAQLDILLAPFAAAAAQGATRVGKDVMRSVMAIMTHAGAALATYAQDSVTDYIEDLTQSKGSAVEASLRLHEALTALIAVIANQREWLNVRFPSRRSFSLFPSKTHRFVEPRDFQMQVVELLSMLNSVMQVADRAGRDLIGAHHPMRYALMGIAPGPSSGSAPPAVTPTASVQQTSSTPPLMTEISARWSIQAVDQLKGAYSETLVFINDFAGQAQGRLEQHARPAGGISAIIVRAQIAITIAFCFQSRLMLQGINETINMVGKNSFIVA